MKLRTWPSRSRTRRLTGFGVVLSGFLCPCHLLTGALLGVVTLLTGASPVLSPSVQDGAHAVYLPAAVLLGARLLMARSRVDAPRPDGG